MNQVPVTGIDVGKRFSEMAILSPSNQVYARIRINHDAYSNFDRAFELLRKAEKEFEAKPVVIMESTGHYHKILFQTLTKNGYEVCVINPIQSDSIKNIRVRKVKNDKVDAKRIALLYRFGQLKTTNIPHEDIDCLRSLCRHYYKLSDQLTAYKNRLLGIVDQLFLSFTEVFKDVSSCTALAILEKYPTPEDILKADRQKLISLIQKTARKNIKWATGKYESLCSKASNFKPLSINSIANAAMLKANIVMIKTLMQSLDAAVEAIHELLDKDASKDMPVLSLTIELLCSIPGIGLLTAATIIAEIGDFSAFSKPDKLVAYFGVDPSVTQSGQFEGTENKMSKRGPRLLRRVVFTTALANVRKKRNGQEHNPVLYEYYRKKCLSKPKKVALGAVMHKLVSIIFAVLRDRKPFVLRMPEEHAKMLIAKNSAA
ncbi:IS110 family transposase [Petroclostridium sp. X23]|uniref:IS110 family transposase n=1 Tax=Petroclostridium sp. X23 TaxID=3045146 RepID=UPI0024AE2706|nr:IS110 family transposase [Petroclostridium sp. X23]WHH59860.1 IS110 family transposase [Petroclostridium sp. X23]WHH60410.1 IS110 family transposase [Petroclostridium sp. X23]WHH60918.1 IS110 family transposase [Petroclostridium sp. X23]WHH60963.1 IS110 family transposase [Petroclostridium sp. X23]WHH61150.1 IS110 family transposase [Petroclostridium sp. X23]